MISGILEICKDFPHVVDIYKHHLKMNKYIPRLYRARCRQEVCSILTYGKHLRDTYLRLGPRDLGFIYADADRRSEDNEVMIADWIMDFIEAEKPWNSLRYQ